MWGGGTGGAGTHSLSSAVSTACGLGPTLESAPLPFCSILIPSSELTYRSRVQRRPEVISSLDTAIFTNNVSTLKVTQEEKASACGRP